MGSDALLRQHPPGEKPSIVVMFAEPPSVEGIGGGQMVAEAAGAPAVVLAPCVEVSGASPGNSTGVCELSEEDAPIPPVLPPTEDPLVVAADVPEENGKVDGSDDAGTLSGVMA